MSILQANGTLDTTFGNNGKVRTDFRDRFGIPQSDQADAVVIQRDGKIMAAGISSSGGFAIARYRNFFCGGLDVTILGTAGNDILSGTNNRDVIHGLDGDDRIRGLGGDDILCGGAGNDILLGGDGTDTCDGGSGNADTVLTCETLSHIP